MLVHQFNIEANPNMAKSTREIIFQTHCFGSMLDLGGASLLSRPPAAFIFEIVSNMTQAQTPPSTQWLYIDPGKIFELDLSCFSLEKWAVSQCAWFYQCPKVCYFWKFSDRKHIPQVYWIKSLIIQCLFFSYVLRLQPHLRGWGKFCGFQTLKIIVGYKPNNPLLCSQMLSPNSNPQSAGRLYYYIPLFFAVVFPCDS